MTYRRFIQRSEMSVVVGHQHKSGLEAITLRGREKIHIATSNKCKTLCHKYYYVYLTFHTQTLFPIYTHSTNNMHASHYASQTVWPKQYFGDNFFA